MIDRFRGEYAFLSNFHPARVNIPIGDVTISFPSVEHAYQACKTRPDDPERLNEMADVARLTAGKAKLWGKRVALRPDWNRVKLPIMGALLERKFADINLLNSLLATRPHELVEGNDWGDTFWGACRGKGSNHLGKLLMKIRG